jgi:hypothetical protein
MSYRFNWGEGVISAWSASTSASHSWLQPGSYCVKAQARDSEKAVSGWSECAAITVTANQPPVISGPPKGPSTIATGISAAFAANATDPENSPMSYRFDWGDGVLSAWSASTSRSRKWLSSGTYCVKTQARDTSQATSDWSACALVRVSYRPVLAGPPLGSSDGIVGNSYLFLANATDPDGDPIRYRFSWGDGKVTSWAAKASASHKWTVPNSYCVKVQAIDDKGLSSPWSRCANIQIEQ